jgi:hypothetical protein
MSIAAASLPVTAITGRDTIAADLGVTYTASTVPGTGLITHAVNSTFVETKPVFMVFNGGNLNIYPLYMRITCTVVGTGNPTILSSFWTTTLDQGNRFSAFVTGNALTPVNTNQSSTNVSLAQISAGAITATAASPNRRIVSHRQVRPLNAGGTINAPVAGDTYQFSYGSGELADPCSLTNASTTVANVLYVISPLVVVPGTSMCLYSWAATSSAGPTFEYEFGYVEK